MNAKQAIRTLRKAVEELESFYEEEGFLESDEDIDTEDVMSDFTEKFESLCDND